jgi:predicted DCC family thiol-disulfide oxidoreductase YuxK
MKSSNDKAIVLFDGVCSLCISSVKFINARDKDGYFMFSPLQSSGSNQILSQLNYDGRVGESVILIQQGRVYDKSTAVLKILRHLKGLWRLLYIFMAIPKFIRDPVYDFIARRRY